MGETGPELRVVNSQQAEPQKQSRFERVANQFGKIKQKSPFRNHQREIAAINVSNFIARRRLEVRAHERDLQVMDLKKDAETDPKTKLLNERGFNERSKVIVELLKRTGIPAIFVRVDVNKLKQVNDTQGHDAGDRLITETADMLSSDRDPRDVALPTDMRSTDIYGRSSEAGDEFSALLVNCDRDGAKRYAGRVMDDLKGKGVSISIGAALIDPRDDATVSESEDLAETAMMVSKLRSRTNQTGGSEFTLDSELTEEQIMQRETLKFKAKQRTEETGQSEEKAAA